LGNKIQNVEDIRSFAQKLHLLKLNSIDSIFYEMLPLCGFGPTISFSRFLALQKKIVFASHALINAYRINHQSLWGVDLEDSLLERSMYFENAIESYNKVTDYVYLILYFNFELYEVMDRKEIKSKEDIVEISKKIKGKKYEAINEWLIKDIRTSNFAKQFSDYRDSVKEMRELANDIKHRGCIAIDGTGIRRNTRVTKVIEGHEIDITDQVSEVKIDIDEEIEKLVIIHQETLELQKELFGVCAFQKQLKDFLEAHI